jgi:hypothetical protein
MIQIYVPLMRISGDYRQDGYALIEALLAPEMCNAFLHQFQQAVAKSGATLSQLNRSSNLLRREAVEMYGYHFPPMLTLLWGLTPVAEQVTGKVLLPSYSYFRIYREGDTLRVHSDRQSCEHSMSLTLDYSDGVPWPIELEREDTEPSSRTEVDFGGSPHAALSMRPGDAVLYRGVQRRHGRTTPNPNGWSAHLFLHWVERDGSYAEYAFDKNAETARPVNFSFR